MKKMLVASFLLAALIACSKKQPTTTPTNTGGKTEMKSDGKSTGGSTYGGDMKKTEGGSTDDPCAAPH